MDETEFLSAIWRRIRRQDSPSGRPRRYAMVMLGLITAVWVTTGLYLALAPKRYASEFSLILPGSGVGSTLNVESIGQAQSSASSAFSSPSLSPTENYKQLLMADVTRRAAARQGNEEEGAFPEPAVRLVDQTNLIHVKIKGANPQQANRRAQALLAAFLAQLERLRADEASKREIADVRHLEDLSIKVREAQRRLIAFQASHGLATLEQFNSRIAAVDQLRDRERELRLQARQQASTAGRLSGSLRSSPRSADLAMRLRGDPLFQELAQRYATSNADTRQKSATLGPNHSTLAQSSSETAELRSALVRRGRELTGLPEQAVLSAVDIQLAEGRSNLMQAMSVQDAQAAGSAAALAELRSDLARAQAKSPELIAQASELADLQRDHRVAEAVFSSALARIDTNKQDPFASYPLVQTLTAPSLPSETASPSWPIALAGAAAATFLILLAFALLWIRKPLLDSLFPND